MESMNQSVGFNLKCTGESASGLCLTYNATVDVPDNILYATDEQDSTLESLWLKRILRVT